LRSYKLTVPREEENEGLLLLGDPGTGKSQIMHQLLDVIAGRERFEAAVVYDPAGEFVEQHFNPQTDIILNPLDARSATGVRYRRSKMSGTKSALPSVI
jgi:hypothetical protein